MSRQAVLSYPNHTIALVPLGAGYHQSMDVFARGRSIDTGLLAEALIYYEHLLIQVDNPVQFSELISLLIQQGLSIANIIGLFEDGVLGIYNFAFTTNPYVDFLSPDSIQIHGLYNIQDRAMLEPNSFFQRFLGFEPLRRAIEDRSEFDRFVAALEGRVVEVKA